MRTVCYIALTAALFCPTAKPADFTRDVQPALTQRCAGCHGPAQQMAGLRVDDASSLVKGSHGGAVVTPGNAAASKIVSRVTSAKPGFMMPPAGERMTAAEVAALRAWIDAGAPAPKQAPASAAKSQPANVHWSFRPVDRPSLPQVRARQWVRNPIDAFVLARLETEGLEPSPEAAKSTLLRRLSLDLTGLPPTTQEQEAFLRDNRTDAYERVVDRLLASPHYGERQARPWLDLARYADSDGYEKDLVRPYAWRYRNWVIDAFNRDMPFDQFSLEQLAGDLLPNATVEQRVATGFHRNVLTNREAGVDRAEARFEQNINRANTISTVWLGLTAGCAQCHNHKYDPISQREYYQLFAYVNNVEENDIDAPLPGELGPYLKTRPEFDRSREAILQEYDILSHQRAFEEKLRAAHEKPGADVEWDFMMTEFRARVDNSIKILLTPWEKRSRRQQERMTQNFLRYLGPDVNRDQALAKRLREARDKLGKLESSFTPLTEAMTIAEDGSPPQAHIAVGGDHRNPGDPVEPGVPAVLGGGKPKNRLEFARWLFSTDNPLTARVAVNRMWQELFGRGIVRTSEDFGTQGERPSHPELLDWLAAEFRDSGWSMKHMVRLIVTSAAYRQSSNARKELLQRDPDNALLARQARLRLPAESIRDSALAAGGLLNTAIGGRSVRPPQPAGVAELGYANNVKWVESQGPERYRRGLYVHFQRTTPYPMLIAFDAPGATVSCSRRTRSNTPLQALNLLNDPVFLEAAQGFALRVMNEGANDRISTAFRIALGRGPNARERDRVAKLLEQQKSVMDAGAIRTLMPLPPEGVDAADAAAWVAAGRVLLNLDEFVTRE